MQRRDWLEYAALASATIGLPKLGYSVDRRASTRPYLDLALDAARWIERSRQTTDRGPVYPANPLDPTSVGLDFYNGMPGVTAFHAALAYATGAPAWLDAAEAGADSLVRLVDQTDRIDAGLYTGLAGLAYTCDCVAAAGGARRHHEAAVRLTARITAAARRDASGARWSESWDIISGAAGTGLYLLEAGRARGDRALVDLAGQAGHALLAAARPRESGLMWYPAEHFNRNYPNFSHGTSGVGYFLASLYRATRERAFLEGALAAARYLDAVAARDGNGIKVFHQDGGGENRFYLSWCHGPPGTARLFYRLSQITGEARWSTWIDGLTNAVFDSGAPERRSAGYWDNISQCCGNVGIGQYCIDLIRWRPTAGTEALLERVVDDTRRRATKDDTGLRWIQAENRTQPDNLVAQTGFMQGAAGVGMFYLQLDALQRGAAWPFPLPDTPCVAG